METSDLQKVAKDIPFLKSDAEKEKLLGVVGALVLRRISLNRAAEIMVMKKDALLVLLDALGVGYSYLEMADIKAKKFCYTSFNHRIRKEGAESTKR